MKTEIDYQAKKRIEKIHLDKSNIEHILKTNNIDGTLMLDVISLFRAGVEFAQQWISVNDRLPLIGESCKCSKNLLLKDKSGNEIVGKYSYQNGEKCFHSNHGFLEDDVEYWRVIDLV